MQITRIELENITTHHHTEIEFKEGINVFLGQNGAGKSTILKMIGIVLFDYHNGRLDQYVTTNSSKPTGKVSVWFVGKDQKEYKVSRVIGGSKIEIIDANTNKVLSFINTKDDYIRFLKEQYNLDETYDLNTLFENAIGVEQGSFTTPFTYTAPNRKKVFDPILRIDVYEDIFHNFNDINKVFENRRVEIEKNISGYQGQLTDKESNLKELKEKEEENTNKQKLIVDLQQKQEIINSEFNNLKSIKDNIEKIKTQIQLLETKKKSLEDARLKLKNDVEESEKSKAICDQNKKNYEEYLKVEKEINEIKEKIKDLDSLVKKSQKIEQEIAKITGLIGKYTEDIKSIEKDAEKKDELEKLNEKYIQLNNNLKKLQGKISEIETEEKNLKQFNKEKEKYEREIAELTKEIGTILDLEILQKRKKELQEIYENNSNELTKLETQKQELLKNKNQAKGGQCPFLHEACKNIEGESLENHFETQLEKLSPQIEKLKKSIKENKKSIELNDEEIEKTHEKYKKKQTLDEKKVALENLNKNIKVKESEIAVKPTILAQKEECEKEIQNLEPLIKEWTVLQDKLKTLEKIKNEVKRQQNQLNKSQSDLTELKLQMDPLENLKKNIQPLEDRKNTNKQSYELYQQNNQNAIKLESRKAEYSKICQEIKENEIEFQNNRKTLIDLSGNFNEKRFKELEEQKNKILEDLSRLKGELDQLIKRIKDLKEKIELYRKIEKELSESIKKQQRYLSIEEFCNKMRLWYRDAGKIITDAMIRKISNRASSIFQDIMDTPGFKLEWTNDYEVIIKSKFGDRSFKQLSGGEQMSAALSIRLALLLSISNIDIAFFDEPTANLDPEKRMNLANCIRKIKGLNQLFVISHDDTFENLTENIIVFEKDSDESTKVTTKNSSRTGLGGV